MNKEILGGKIASLRKSKGLSQEELAGASSINLRTLQRIEGGQTEPRGQTLRLIAKALDMPLEDFVDPSTMDFQMNAPDDNRFLQTMNLSALTFWLIPFGNVLIPLLLWGIRRDKTPRADALRKRLVAFQLVWTVLLYGYVYLGIIRYHITPPFGISHLQLILGFCLFNSVCILIAAFQIRRGNERVYSFGA